MNTSIDDIIHREIKCARGYPKVKLEVYLGEVTPGCASVPSRKSLAVAPDRRTRHRHISGGSY